jgi:hypothetical protein
MQLMVTLEIGMTFVYSDKGQWLFSLESTEVLANKQNDKIT